MEFEQQTSDSLHHGSYIFTFSSAVFWSQDSLFSELINGISLSSQDVDSKEEETLERSLKFATDKGNNNVLFHLMTELLEQHHQPYLFAHFFLQNGKEIFLTYDVRRFEEVAILNPLKEMNTDDRPIHFRGAPEYQLHLINSFHIPEEYTSKNEYELASENKRGVLISYPIPSICQLTTTA